MKAYYYRVLHSCGYICSVYMFIYMCTG